MQELVLYFASAMLAAIIEFLPANMSRLQHPWNMTVRYLFGTLDMCHSLDSTRVGQVAVWQKTHLNPTNASNDLILEATLESVTFQHNAVSLCPCFRPAFFGKDELYSVDSLQQYWEKLCSHALSCVSREEHTYAV